MGMQGRGGLSQAKECERRRRWWLVLEHGVKEEEIFLQKKSASDESIPKSVDVKGFSHTPVHDVEVDVLQEEQCRGYHHQLPFPGSGLPPPCRLPPSFQIFAFK